MMSRSMPPASAHLADRPMPAPPPTIGLPAATWARRRCKHSSRLNMLMVCKGIHQPAAPARATLLALRAGRVISLTFLAGLFELGVGELDADAHIALFRAQLDAVQHFLDDLT